MGKDILPNPDSQRITGIFDGRGSGIDHRYVAGRESGTAL